MLRLWNRTCPAWLQGEPCWSLRLWRCKLLLEARALPAAAPLAPHLLGLLLAQHLLGRLLAPHLPELLL